MALQMRSGDAAFYQCAEYCRNYTSPPVSYSDSSHYLARLPGKKKNQELLKSLMRYCADWLRRWLEMVQRMLGVEKGCPNAAVNLMSCCGVQQPPFCSALSLMLCKNLWLSIPFSFSAEELCELSHPRSEVWNKKQYLDCIHFKWCSQRRWENKFLYCVICTDDMWKLNTECFPCTCAVAAKTLFGGFFLGIQPNVSGCKLQIHQWLFHLLMIMS